MNLRNLFEGVARPITLGVLLATTSLSVDARGKQPIGTNISTQTQAKAAAHVRHTVYAQDVSEQNQYLLEGARDQAALYANRYSYPRLHDSIFKQANDVLANVYFFANITSLRTITGDQYKLRNKNPELNRKILEARKKLGKIDRVYRVFRDAKYAMDKEIIDAQNKYINDAQRYVRAHARSTQMEIRNAIRGLKKQGIVKSGGFFEAHPLHLNTFIVELDQPVNGSLLGYATFGANKQVTLITNQADMRRFDDTARRQVEHSLKGEFGDPRNKYKRRAASYIGHVLKRAVRYGR